MASNGAASAAEVVIELSSSSDGSASRRATAAKTPRRRPNRQRVAPNNNSANKSMSPSTTKRTIDEMKKEKKKLMKSGDAEVIKSKEMKKKGESKMGINNASSAPTALAIDGTVSCSFPMTRVWRLIRSEGGATTRTTNDAVFLINKASEMFLDVFAEDAFVNSTRERKMSISYNNLSSAVCNAKRYEFLSDFVPEQVRAEDAMKATTALAET